MIRKMVGRNEELSGINILGTEDRLLYHLQGQGILRIMPQSWLKPRPVSGLSRNVKVGAVDFLPEHAT